MPGIQGGLEDFLRQRRNASQDSRRQEIQKNFKVSVPVTKLEHTKSPSLTLRPSQSLAPSRSPAQHGSRRPLDLQPGSVSNGEGDRFDTDAEGLDDTTVTSTTYDNGVIQNLVPTLSRNVSDMRDEGSDYQASVANDGLNEERLDNRRYNHPRTEQIGFGGDSESYEESEYEEGGGYEEDIDQELTEEVLKGLDSPDYLQFHQERTSLSKEEAVKSPMISIATCNGHGKTNESQSLSTPKPFPKHLHSAGGGNVAFGGKVQRQTQARHSATLDKALSPKEHKARDGPSELRKEPDLRMALQRTIPVRNVSSQQTTAASGQLQPWSKLQTLEGPIAGTQDHNSAKIRQLIRGQDGSVSPALLDEGTAKPEDVRDNIVGDELQSKATENAKSYTSSHADPNENNFLLGKDPVKDTTNDNDTMEPKSAQTGQKRGRDLDYSQAQLATMSFQQLKDEAFHIDPQAPKVLLPLEVEGGALAGKLEFLLKVKDSEERNAQQGAFLKSLPIEEYEECGDIIVDRFGEMVKRFKQARQERRKAAKAFEGEVARREESVRGKIDAFEKDFSRLKQSGEDVVRKRLAM